MVWEEKRGCVMTKEIMEKKKEKKREYKNYPKALVSPSFPWTPFVMLFIKKKTVKFNNQIMDPSIVNGLSTNAAQL